MSINDPTVPDRFSTEPYAQSIDIQNRLLRERVIVLGKEIDHEVANQIIALLLHLDAEDPDKDIRLQINSPGGAVTAALAIADTMQQLTSDVITICVGLAQGASSLLLAVGTHGKRLALPHARIKLDHPATSLKQGSARDMELEAREILNLHQQVNELFAIRTGQPLEKIEKDTVRGVFLSADEALEYGIVDQIIESPYKRGRISGKS